MEGTAATSDMNANTTGRVSLEDMSRDDILRQVRRQRVLMQKMKNKCDELNEKCGVLEKEKRELFASETQVAELKAQVELLNSEKEVATTAYANIQAAQEEQLQQFEEYEQRLGVAAGKKQQLEQALQESDKKCRVLQKQYQSSEEQAECLKLKLSTLTSTCQYLQDDLKKVQLGKKELEDDLRVMEEARDQALQSLKGWKESANENFTETEKLKGEVQILKIERNELLEKYNRNLETKESLVEKVQDLQEEKEKLLKIISEEQEKMTILKSELESVTVQTSKDKLTEEQQIETIKDENSSLKISLDEIKNENSALIVKIEQLSVENEQKAEVLKSENGSLIMKNEELIKELKRIEENYNNELNELRNDDRIIRLNEAVSQIGKLETDLSIVIQAKQDAIEELIQVKDLQRFVEDEAKELREENEKLKTEIKTLEADLENDKMHIRKLEKEIHSTEEREHNLSVECERIKLKVRELEKINEELRDNVISEEIEELIEKYKSLQTEKDVLLVQVENLTQEINIMNQQMLKQNCTSCREQDSQTELFCTVDRETSIDNECFNVEAKLVSIHSNISLEVNESKESVQNRSKPMDESIGLYVLEKEDNDTNTVLESQQSLESSVKSNSPNSPRHYLLDISKEEMKGEANSDVVNIVRMSIDANTQTMNLDDTNDKDKVYEAVKLSKSTSCGQIDVKEKAIQSEVEEGVDSESKLDVTSRIEELTAELEETRNDMSLINQEKCALLDDYNKLLNDNQTLDRDYKDATEKLTTLTEMLQDKSEIAEKIHCQMDSLLNQIDELNSQLEEKENDLASAGRKLQNKTEALCELRKTYELKSDEHEICKKELEELQSGGYHLRNECPLIENYNTLLEKNNKLQEGCEMLQASNNELKEKLGDVLKTAENQKSEEISALTHEIESFQLLCREKENEINHLHQINKDVNKDLLHAMQEISILNEFKKQCEQYKIDLVNLRKEKSELENEILLLTSKIEHSENEIILQLQENINKSSNEISHLKEEIIKYQSSIEESRREIDSVMEEKQKAKEKICILEKHLKTVELYSTEKCLKVQEEANSLREQLESLKHYVKSMTFFDEFALIKRYLVNIESLEAETKHLKIELAEKQALLDDCRCKLEESKQQLTSVCSSSEAYAKQNTILQRELENIRAIHSNSANEIGSYQERLREQTHMLEQLETEKSELLEKIASLKLVNDVPVESSDVERVKKELKDSEDKMRKMKALALKTRRELADVKKQLNEMAEERNHLKKRNDQLLQENEKTLSDCRQYLSNFQSLQSEYDKIEDKYEAERLQTKQLQQDIVHSAAELVSTKEKLEELKFENESLKKGLNTITSEKTNLEHLKLELDGKVIMLDSFLQNETKKNEETKNELQNILQKVKQLEDQLKSERLQHTSTTQQLEQALKEAKQQNLLNLEIDDYKRIVSETKAALEEKVRDIKELHSQLAHEKEKHCILIEEMNHIESQWKTEESRANNLKELLSRTKEELSKLEHQEVLLNEKLSEQQRQLESLAQQEELYKVQLSEASAENRKLYETVQNNKDSQTKTTKSLETKIDILEEQLRMAGLEVESTKQEFENYKIRVHSVLKQKKEQSPVPSTQDDTKQQMEKLIEQSRAKLEELSQKLQASLAENSALQDEKDQLVHHLTKLTEETQMKEGMWTKRLNQMIIERDSFQKQQESLSEQLQQQNQMLTATFKQRLQTMQEKHNTEINSLQKQLEAADVEISHLQREYQKSSSPAHPPDDLPHFDIFSQERQEGEGSECTDRESITPIVNSSLNTIPTSGFLPFEQLLQAPIESLSASVTSSRDVDTLSSGLATTHKKLEHVTELLNESEANNLRMTEQVRVLKEEIRRLERNKERQDHAENLEYLKNIIVKFITLEGGDERIRLIPVLTTMLRLSPEEQAQMLNIASDEASSNASSGWGNYLHRWSGLV